MYKAMVKHRLAKFDQHNLDLKIKEWVQEYPNDHFFFRGYGKKSIDESELLNDDTDKSDDNDNDDEEIEDFKVLFSILKYFEYQ